MAKQLFGWADQPDVNVARDGTLSARASTLLDALNEILGDFGYVPIVSVKANGAWLADPSKILDELREILRTLDDVPGGAETAIGTASTVASTFLDSLYEIRRILDAVPVVTEKPARASLGGASTGLDSPDGTLCDGGSAPVVTETPNDMPTTGGAPGLNSRNEILRDIGNEPVVPEKSNDMPTAGESTSIDSLDEILRDTDDVPVVPEKFVAAAPEKPIQVIPNWRATSADGKDELNAPALGLMACTPLESAVAIAAHLASTSPSAMSIPQTIAAPTSRRRYLALATGIALAVGMSFFIPFAPPGDRILPPAVTETFAQSINTVIVWSKNWRAAPSLTATEAKLVLERGVAATAWAPSKATADPPSAVELDSASSPTTESDFSPDLLTPIGSSPSRPKASDLAGETGVRKTSPLPTGPAAPEMAASGAAVAKAPPTSAIAADRAPGAKVVAAAVPAIAPASLPAIPEAAQVIPEGPGTSAPLLKSQSISVAAIPPLLPPELPDATVGRAASSGSDASKPAQGKITEQRNETQSLSSVAPRIQRTTDLTASTGMREQGDAQMIKGDISTARLYYGVAAANGDADAALSLGNTYNPAFLVRLGVLGMRGDVTEATDWYHRAQALGSGDAERALQTLPQ